MDHFICLHYIYTDTFKYTSCDIQTNAISDIVMIACVNICVYDNVCVPATFIT